MNEALGVLLLIIGLGAAAVPMLHLLYTRHKENRCNFEVGDYIDYTESFYRDAGTAAVRFPKKIIEIDHKKKMIKYEDFTIVNHAIVTSHMSTTEFRFLKYHHKINFQELLKTPEQKEKEEFNKRFNQTLNKLLK